jgi:hypothetical protein
MAIITLEVVPFCTYGPFPALLPLINASWRLCSVRVFDTVCNSVWITSSVSKWRPFSFILNWGYRKVGWVGGDSHVVSGKKFPGEKGSVRLCVVMMQQAVLFVTKVWGEVFAHFHAITIKVIVVCRIDCLACRGEFFVNNPLHVRENDEHVLDFALQLSCLFWSR